MHCLASAYFLVCMLFYLHLLDNTSQTVYLLSLNFNQSSLYLLFEEPIDLLKFECTIKNFKYVVFVFNFVQGCNGPYHLIFSLTYWLDHLISWSMGLETTCVKVDGPANQATQCILIQVSSVFIFPFVFVYIFVFRIAESSGSIFVIPCSSIITFQICFRKNMNWFFTLCRKQLLLLLQSKKKYCWRWVLVGESCSVHIDYSLNVSFVIAVHMWSNWFISFLL